MQKTMIIGNLCADPEFKQISADRGVCNFTVAVNERRKGTTEQKEANYYRVAAWGKLGEVCKQYLSKGKKVHIEGVVHARGFMGKDGTAQAALELTAEDVEFLSASGQSGMVQNGTAQAPAISAPVGFTPVSGEELPF